MADLTYSQVSRLLKYEPETGKLFWLPRPPEMFPSEERGASHCANIWNSRYAEKEAFTVPRPNGYMSGTLLGGKYLAHRIAWLLHHTVWPTRQIDHINGIRTDNRICNLRDVSGSINHRNASLPPNRSGVTGVRWNARNRNWQAFVYVNRRYIHLGVFQDIQSAAQARAEACRKYGFTSRHGAG